jgi:hypothetical protein
MSTLEKEDLLSPDNVQYVMKYPRLFDGTRVNWEDINEVIAAEIAKLLGLKTVEAEIAYRKDRRGCLMLHFIDQYNVDIGETGASLLLAELRNEYDLLTKSPLKDMALIEMSFSLFERFSYVEIIKFDFIMMNIYDVLIGNQDRHPFNWQILFNGDKCFFGPLYDNGASLGWQFSDGQLNKMMLSQSALHKFFKNTRIKAGLFENKQPPLKATQVLTYLKLHYSNELKQIVNTLKKFDFERYSTFIEQFPLISKVRKEFLITLIKFRMNKLLQIIE